jgi:hypothetical protein
MFFFHPKPHVPPAAPTIVNSEPREQPASPPPAPEPPPTRVKPESVTTPAEDDEIIKRFEPLLVHCPRNSRVFKTLAGAYARKMRFAEALTLYQRALEIVGGRNAAIEMAIAETNMKKLDLALSQLDPNAPDFATESERIKRQKSEFEWRAMEEAP